MNRVDQGNLNEEYAKHHHQGKKNAGQYVYLEWSVKNNSFCRDEKLHSCISRYNLNNVTGKMHRKSMAFQLNTILKTTASSMMYARMYNSIQYDLLHSFFLYIVKNCFWMEAGATVYCIS